MGLTEEELKEFEDIRPYNDDEYKLVTKRLSNNKYLQSFIRTLRWPNCPKILIPPAEILIGQFVRKQIRQNDTIAEFQRDLIINRLVQWVVDKTTDGVSCTGLDELDMENESYLFISNHRDIVLDAGFINYFMIKYGYPTTQIAFGDNLLINEFVGDLIRINRSFIVKRDLPPREQIKASITLSKYINHVIDLGECIWIAQKEGRSKDGADQTNPAVIKMIYLSQRKSELAFSDFINKCRIVPVSISYELDPCDTLKGWEMYRRETRDVGAKTQTMDLVSMWAGMKGQKGRVNVNFGKPLTGTFENDKDVAKVLDHEIHRGYKLWPSNYISFDEINKSEKYKDRYSEEERQEFLSRYHKLGEPVMQKVLGAYARPVLNQEEAVFTDD
ncbi:MAG TPA: acyltransferase [Spirochaeta sp.]|nr:acyltransferase [Spirochaeta sp.]